MRSFFPEILKRCETGIKNHYMNNNSQILWYRISWELFSLKKKHFDKEISGQVVACDTKTQVQGATVKIVDTINNTTITSKVTDADGRYSFTIEEFLPLQAVASASGYYSNSIKFDSPEEDGATTPPWAGRK